MNRTDPQLLARVREGLLVATIPLADPGEALGYLGHDGNSLVSIVPRPVVRQLALRLVGRADG